MRCDVCDKEFANSMELDKHKEREHPMGSDDDLEKPDNMRENVSQAPIVPGKN